MRANPFCPQGHEYTPENTVINGKGYRVCRECMNTRQRRRRQRSRQPREEVGPLGLYERLIDRSGECWIWTGRVNERGYGLAVPYKTSESTARRAHRRAWETVNGPIPEGLVIDHLCHTLPGCAGGPTCPHRRCVRPDHMALTTPQENLKRGNKAGRKPQKFCKHGHEFTPENTYLHPRGYKACIMCRRESKRRANDKRAAREEE